MSTQADPQAIIGTVPAEALDMALVARARHLRQQSKRTLVEELETLTGMEPRHVVQALAQPFGMAVLETVDMLAFTPAFDLLPLSQALARHCVLLRGHDDMVIGVIADPFDLDLQTWLGTQARATPHAPLQTRLALQADIQAYLSKQEESARATDTLLPGASEGRRDGKTAAVLSFASVSEAASPAVRLVNSTLYDALKAGASDIHLESTAGGLVIKYRVDGVLVQANGQWPRQSPSRSSRASRCWRNWTSPSAACRRTAASASRVAAARSTSASPSCLASSARTRCCACSTSRALTEAAAALTAGKRWASTTPSCRSCATGRQAARHAAGDRPDRLRQDHHAVRRADRDQHGRDKIITIEDPVEYQLPRRAADSRQREKGPDLRARPALHPAPRSGQDHGRRDPRPTRPRRSRCSLR
jgi:general secretion pathway protein E